MTGYEYRSLECFQILPANSEMVFGEGITLGFTDQPDPTCRAYSGGETNVHFRPLLKLKLYAFPSFFFLCNYLRNDSIYFINYISARNIYTHKKKRK